MKIRVPLVGRGTDDDPYRARLPNYALVNPDYERGVCVVDVPEYILPSQWDVGRQVEMVEVDGVQVVASIPVAMLDALRAHFDKRYSESAGQYGGDLRA